MGALERLTTVALEPENADGVLETDIVWAVAEVERLRVKAERLEADVERLRSELNAHRAKARGEYWVWQSDGEDYPESLACPVLISANDLRGLLRAYAAGGNDEAE